MMNIGNINGTGAALGGIHSNSQAGGSGMNMQTDSVSRNIQNQILNAQKKLQELSSNEEMTPEEKMKKRQEIQQDIASLNQQLRQHLAARKNEQKQKGSSMNDMLPDHSKTKSARNGGKGNALSQVGMQAMISADATMKQAQVQGSVAAQMEGRAGVLEAEIKQDAGRGGDTSRKEAELAGLKEKAQEVTTSQISTLAEAGKAMEEAAKAEHENKSGETDNKDEDKEGRSPKAQTEDDRQNTGEKAESIDVKV